MNNSKLIYVKYFVKNVPHSLYTKIFHKQKPLTSFLGQNVSMEYSSSLLRKYLVSGKPFAAIRFGAVELSCINNYEKIDLRLKKHFKKSVKYSIKNNAGFFPVNEDNLKKYSQQSLDCFEKADVVAVSGIHMEDYFAKFYCKAENYINNYSLEPLLGGWLPLLKDKKVLVISPFAKQMEKQYKNIDKIFPNNEIPQFTLFTIEAPLTLGSEHIEGSDWFNELAQLKEQIKSKDFDIALIGAGAYGSHLAVYVKELGKQALQTGGATQTMFGIIGKRWENKEHVKKFINEYWERPNRVPNHKETIEGGAYW